MSRYYLDSAFIDDNMVRRTLSNLLQTKRRWSLSDLRKKLGKELEFGIELRAFSSDEVERNPDLRARKRRMYECEGEVVVSSSVIYPN